MKTLVCSTGVGMNRNGTTVQLNGVGANEKLTPKMARVALAIAGYYTGTVQGDNGYGYRVYPNSARKIRYN